MNEDVFIKSVVWGGFKKEDVLLYIEKIQSEHIVEMDKLKQKNAETEQGLLQIKQLEKELAAERSRFAALTALNDEYCERIYGLEEKQTTLNKKFENMQDDCNRMKNVESQIGTLLLDAVLYSDKMTQKARQAATIITENAKQTIVSTNDDVSRLSTDITQIAGSFSKGITELVSRIESLSANLSSFACGLEVESETQQEKPYLEQETFAHFFARFNNEKAEAEKAPDSIETASSEETSVVAETIESNELIVEEPMQNTTVPAQAQTEEMSVKETIEGIFYDFKLNEDI